MDPELAPEGRWWRPLNGIPLMGSTMTSLGCVNGDVAVVAVAAVEPQQQQRLD